MYKYEPKATIQVNALLLQQTTILDKQNHFVPQFDIILLPELLKFKLYGREQDYVDPVIVLFSTTAVLSQE